MINVFHIVSNKIWSGPEQYAYDLALRLRNDDNYYIEVVCKKSEAVFNKFRSLEIPVSILPLKGLTDLDSPVRFARLLKRGQNIIHVHTFHDAFAAIWAKHIAENPNTRIVLTLHGVNRPRINYLSKKVYRDLDRIVFVSQRSYDEFVPRITRLDRKKCVIVRDSVLPARSEKLAQGDPGFLRFDNAYSSWSQTVPVLQRALTEQSQYNGKEFFNSASIIDVAKKAGYETWWFSNQGRYGQFDSVITLVAKGADTAEWTDDSYNFSDKYDMVLLDYLKKVDPTKNNFIVLHIMGSHIYYNNRYPSDFMKWKTEDGTGMATAVSSYANSILYTDFFLSQVFGYAREHLNLQAMLYFSDHGENLVISHNPDVFSFDMVRIPMFVYLSPEYQEALPEQSAILRQRHGRYFTNDMLYDTVCGLLNAPSHRYEAQQDFTSPDYGFTRETLTTMLGQHQLDEDPDGPSETFF